MNRHQFWTVVAIAIAMAAGILCAESYACDACEKAKGSGDTCTCTSGDILSPAHTKVKVKLGGYRLSVNYTGGEGGTIAREADEAEVIGPDSNVGVGLAHELLGARDQRAREDICQLFKTPFTRVVTVREPCPMPVRDNCCGLRTDNCCGITRPYGSPGCPGPVLPAYAATPVVAPVYGRCAAWGLVRGTPLGCYMNPPRGREFWCDCADHRAAVLRTYGPSAVWQLVPCMCAGTCGRCGGAGRCGH